MTVGGRQRRDAEGVGEEEKEIEKKMEKDERTRKKIKKVYLNEMLLKIEPLILNVF